MTANAHPTPVVEGITNLLEEWSGALVSRSKVVDGLLDLRSDVRDHPLAVRRIDEALRTMPGQTVVAREWAVEVLFAINDAVATPTAATTV